jgi:hypothetical protein
MHVMSYGIIIRHIIENIPSFMMRVREMEFRREKGKKAKVEGKSSENENPTEWNEMVLKRNTLVPIWNDDKLELAKDSIIAEKREGFHLFIAYIIKTQIISPDVYDDVGHDGKR